jgi:hypothetical protein
MGKSVTTITQQCYAENATKIDYRIAEKLGEFIRNRPVPARIGFSHRGVTRITAIDPKQQDT